MGERPNTGANDLEALLSRRDWQMLHGERLALEALLSALKPALAIEIGTAQGGSLARIAAHSTEVHALDLTAAGLGERPANAELHIGDSRQTLPRLLDSLAADGRVVDFGLVDGDHSAEGVRADLEALLDSPAVARAVILLHDTFNPGVRKGINDADPGSRPDVAAVELDLVPGRVVSSGLLAGQAWGGLGAVVVDREGDGQGLLGGIDFTLGTSDETPLEFHSAPRGAEVLIAQEGAGHDRADLERELEQVRSSLSWRLTAPFRALKRH